MDPLSVFHPVVREWFEGRFAAPTEAQARGWPAIASGSHTLIAAPTGSGKTLAAFLLCIDRLLRGGNVLPDDLLAFACLSCMITVGCGNDGVVRLRAVEQ